MEDYSLGSARGKLRRAERLLDELGLMRDEYIDTFVAEMTRREQQVVAADGTWTVTYAEHVPEVPEELTHLVGDAMHNARSALDHVACACVVANGHSVTNNNAFPIREKPPGKKKPMPFGEIPAVQGMGESHVAAIQRLQPYMNPGSPDARKLVRLALLDNVDKHQANIAAFPVCIGPVPELRVVSSRPMNKAKGERIDYVVSQGGDLRRFPEIVRIKVPDNCNASVPLEFDLAFGHSEVRMAELREIRAYIVGIVESFGPVLDQPIP